MSEDIPSAAVTTEVCPSPVRLYREDPSGGPVQRLRLPCRRRVCTFCGPHHWRPKVLAGLHAGLGDDEHQYLAVLLTAPGDAGVAWNDTASERWHHFVTILRRRFPAADLQYWRVAELQTRGAVHFHFILRGLRYLPIKDSDRGPGLRTLARRAGFGSFVGVKRPRDYPGSVRSAGYYFGKYLLKHYDHRIGITKLVTMSYRWRTAWVRPAKTSGGGWLFAGPVSASWDLLGYVVTPSRIAPRALDRPYAPPWWRRSWQAVRRSETVPEGMEWPGPLPIRAGSREDR